MAPDFTARVLECLSKGTPPRGGYQATRMACLAPPISAKFPYLSLPIGSQKVFLMGSGRDEWLDL
jgi:hypothetical protein